MAIAIDQSSLNANGSSGTSPIISSVNVTGSDRILLVGVNTESTGVNVTGVNLDDGSGGSPQAMTQLGTKQVGDGALSMWYLVAPSTSSNRRIIATLSSNSNWMMVAASYTGVAQTSTFTAAVEGTSATSTKSVVGTSDTDGSWMVGVGQNNNQFALDSGGVTRSSAPTPGSVHTNRLMDSNATVAASATNTFVFSFGAGTMEYVTAMMKPVAAVATAFPKLALMGVGK
jgi:hypothetical protein